MQELRLASAATRGCDAAWRGEVKHVLDSTFEKPSANPPSKMEQNYYAVKYQTVT